MSKKGKSNFVRIQMRISQSSYPELYELLNNIGIYHSSRKVLQLAVAGLTRELEAAKSNLVQNKEPPEAKVQASIKSIEEVQPDQSIKQYKIPASASAEIGDMFESMGA
jgi:hypothetical protein